VVGRGFLVVKLWWIAGESWEVDGQDSARKTCHFFRIYFVGFPFWEFGFSCNLFVSEDGYGKRILTVSAPSRRRRAYEWELLAKIIRKIPFACHQVAQSTTSCRVRWENISVPQLDRATLVRDIGNLKQKFRNRGANVQFLPGAYWRHVEATFRRVRSGEAARLAVKERDALRDLLDLKALGLLLAVTRQDPKSGCSWFAESRMLATVCLSLREAATSRSRRIATCERPPNSLS
jgi:hypothetical protein